ncbi:hypothetical protein FA15DRAFT_380670 [Coprinopsis marcescibilis]|uniref:Glucose receptor Git3 N-terminal domain-containing protein n=1 Tax=Coprinopsis marcescibilis TaxID=230819 RepID=A0A5C3KW92_COPMA|nr:hypothetical protein FA15DRAFT_380670 [Coprinopsis marcescibilis]
MSEGTVQILISPSAATLPYYFLSPAEAHGLSWRNNVLTAAAAVFTWDFLHSLPEESRFLTKFTLPQVVYASSRVITATSVIYSSVYAFKPIGNCITHHQVMSVISTLAIGSCTFLVLIRVRALLHGVYGLPWVFAAVWLVHIILALLSKTVFWSGTGGNIGPTSFCMPYGVTQYHTIAAAVLCFYNTAVFFATSFRLTSILSTEAKLDFDSSTPRGFLCRIIYRYTGKHLPPFSKGILRGGQQYYFVTLMSSVLCVVMPIVTNSVAAGSLFELPNNVIMNIMICRMYRSTKLTSSEEEKKECSSLIMTELVFSPARQDAESQIGTANATVSEGEEVQGDVEAGRAIVRRVDVEGDEPTAR